MRGPNQIGPILRLVGKIVNRKVAVACAVSKSRQNGSGGGLAQPFFLTGRVADLLTRGSKRPRKP